MEPLRQPDPHRYAYLLAKEPKCALTVLEEGTKQEYLRANFWPTHPLIMKLGGKPFGYIVIWQAAESRI